MQNDDNFRNKYSKMPAREFNDLPKEELEEIAKVRYDDGEHQGCLHWLAKRAQRALWNKRYRISSEVKIIKAGEEKESAVSIVKPNVSREKMLAVLKKDAGYSEKYMSMIIKNQDHPASEQDVGRVIGYLRKLFPSTYDFRAAKSALNIYGLDKLETLYTVYFLKNLWEQKRYADKEDWKKAVLDEYGSWQNYFTACGWIEHKGSYYKPEVVKKTAAPDVLGPFHEVSVRAAKRKGYRGKKDEKKAKAVLEEKLCGNRKRL